LFIFSEHFARRRWKTLRDRFKREYDRAQRSANIDGGGSHVVAWPHYQAMLFLVPFIRDKAPTGGWVFSLKIAKKNAK
jgi:hypothetical protein